MSESKKYVIAGGPRVEKAWRDGYEQGRKDALSEVEALRRVVDAAEAWRDYDSRFERRVLAKVVDEYRREQRDE